MLLSQKCRDRARKEIAQLSYTKGVIDQFSIDTNRKTPRSQSRQSARSQRIVQSQVIINILFLCSYFSFLS